MMSQSRRKNLLKTLSKTDIEQVLDEYGSEQPMFHPLMYGNDSGHVRKFTDAKCGQSEMGKIHPSDLREEWEYLFGANNFAPKLRRSALNGNLGSDNFRSICWRIFWECLSESKENWVKEVTEKRKLYDEVRNKYVIDPYEKEQHADLEKHHPLSQAEDSIWHQYFQDNELRNTIMQDLDRLFPEIDFFQQDCVKLIILHILFCYARENPQVQYKQGMHEILSPIIYVMVLNSLVVKESGDELDDNMKTVMDLKYIEYDAYALFYNIMETIEPWYANLQPHPLQGNQTTAISKKLTRIQCYMLKRYDNTLREHLEKNDVTPQLYGIRWVRLLFGREFSLNRLLILWDAIFADGIDLVDYIYLAMLIYLRGALLQSDFSECVRYLMKYPANTDTKYILKRAVGLKNHKFTETAKYIPRMEVIHTDSNVMTINPVEKSISFHSQKNGQVEHSDNSVRSDVADIKPSVSHSIASQLSHIKNKVGTTTQMISRLSNPLKTKPLDKQYIDVDALIEDHGHLQKQVSELQSQLDKINTLSIYCGGKMDLYINLLHQCLAKEEKADELGIHSFAGLKQIRDILKDGMEHCSTIADHEDDFRDIDEHIADASNNLKATASNSETYKKTYECGEKNETVETASTQCSCPTNENVIAVISNTEVSNSGEVHDNREDAADKENDAQGNETDNTSTLATRTNLLPTAPLSFDTKYFRLSVDVECKEGSGEDTTNNTDCENHQEGAHIEGTFNSCDSASYSTLSTNSSTNSSRPYLDPLSAFQIDSISE